MNKDYLRWFLLFFLAIGQSGAKDSTFYDDYMILFTNQSYGKALDLAYQSRDQMILLSPRTQESFEETLFYMLKRSPLPMKKVVEVYREIVKREGQSQFEKTKRTALLNELSEWIKRKPLTVEQTYDQLGNKRHEFHISKLVPLMKIYSLLLYSSQKKVFEKKNPDWVFLVGKANFLYSGCGELELREYVRRSPKGAFAKEAKALLNKNKNAFTICF